jgi:ATP-dependent Clp endopeptidase proteolytic subunit ClpP
MKQWFSITARGPSVGNVAIFDEIGAGGVGAGEFHEQLRGLGNVSKINLSINSPGGEVFAGLSIHNMLARHKARVVVTVDGIAASIASVIAMAGDEVVMPENSMMMIHDPSGGVIGTADDMREMAEALDKIRQSLVSAYAGKSRQPRDKIESLMAETTWLTAREAVEMKFADRIEQPMKIAAQFDLQARFGKVPKAAAGSWDKIIAEHNARIDAQFGLTR